MRVIALLAAHNEERYIAGCLEHLFHQGVHVYLIDNDSTDNTVAIAECFLGKGLVGVERLPRAGIYSWRAILERKEELAWVLDADWFMHVDADEIRLPPHPYGTLAEALATVGTQGYNAVNFMEFTFIPTQEAPDHDHPAYQQTMRWYYPFLPSQRHRVNAWRRQRGRVELAWSGGHQVRFPQLRVYPTNFPMRHYLFLSVAHAIRKFVERRYDPNEVRAGWHGWRARLEPKMIKLPRQGELRTYVSDDRLDPSRPRTSHYLADMVAGPRRRKWL